jgi:hypothetical protein
MHQDGGGDCSPSVSYFEVLAVSYIDIGAFHVQRSKSISSELLLLEFETLSWLSEPSNSSSSANFSTSVRFLFMAGKPIGWFSTPASLLINLFLAALWIMLAKGNLLFVFIFVIPSSESSSPSYNTRTNFSILFFSTVMSSPFGLPFS